MFYYHALLIFCVIFFSSYVPEHANALRKAGLAPPDFPTVGDLWKMQDEKLDIENEKEPDVNKKKTEMSIFVFPTHVISQPLSTGSSTD